MTIKDFEAGQKAYILCMHKGRNCGPSIIRESVKAIGRKYVTTSSDRRYFSSDRSPYGLLEARDWGEETLLCPSMEDAAMHIEWKLLELWLYNISSAHKRYTLEQLRQVKAILEPC